MVFLHLLRSIHKQLFYPMAHPLEIEYGLTAYELLEAIDKRFRAKVTLAGAVAEVQLEKRISALKADGLIWHYEAHDTDGQHDFSIYLDETSPPIRIECKNVRNSDEAFRERGSVVAYKVETQKTRTSNSDASSRFYGVDQFDILAVCLGKKTHDWTEFMFVWVHTLARHSKYPEKLSPIQRVPLKPLPSASKWFDDLGTLIRTFVQNEEDRTSI